MIKYDALVVSADALEAVIDALNRCQDKIIAVTQCGNTYTIFYEKYGNKKEKRNV